MPIDGSGKKKETAVLKRKGSAPRGMRLGSPFSYQKEAGAACSNGNDISCGEYRSQAELEAACARDDACVAYSTWVNNSLPGYEPGEGWPWCMKSEYSPRVVAKGHDCYVKGNYQTDT